MDNSWGIFQKGAKIVVLLDMYNVQHSVKKTIVTTDEPQLTK